VQRTVRSSTTASIVGCVFRVPRPVFAGFLLLSHVLILASHQVFMCQFVKHIASHLDPTDCEFTQRDMPMIRWQMVHEIVTAKVE
jgi:hypothetical protein